MMKEIHFPWEAQSGAVHAKHKFLRELAAWAQIASWEHYRLSFSIDRLLVPEKYGCEQTFSGDFHALRAGYVGS